MIENNNEGGAKEMNGKVTVLLVLSVMNLLLLIGMAVVLGIMYEVLQHI